MARMLAMNRRRWLWVILFVWFAILVAVLATGWNVVIVQDYYRMAELARKFATPGPDHSPWPSVIFGTLGFLAVLGTMVLFFVRLLKEMRLTQVQSEFLATITHELKTPIAALELNSSLIREGGLSEEEVRRLWQSHSSELKRLREEVETLLEAARWSSGAVKNAIPTRMRLERWLGDSMDRWRTLLGTDARLSRVGDALDDAEIELDLKAFNLITDNLVDNARKYAMGKPELVVRTERAGRRWKISFEDKGWGFQPEESKKIFSRFHRLRTGAPSAIPGTGLGLFLADTASRQLGISLKAHSEGPGKGAIFTLEGNAT